MKTIMEIINNENLNNKKIILKQKQKIAPTIKTTIKTKIKEQLKIEKTQWINNRKIQDNITAIFTIELEKGIGKSYITVFIARALKNKFNQKVLIINLGILNQNIYFILEIKKFFSIQIIKK